MIAPAPGLLLGAPPPAQKIILTLSTEGQWDQLSKDLKTKGSICARIDLVWSCGAINQRKYNLPTYHGVPYLPLPLLTAYYAQEEVLLPCVCKAIFPLGSESSMVPSKLFKSMSVPKLLENIFRKNFVTRSPD